MRGKIYKVHLTADEKKRLEDMVTKGVHPVREVTHARILLLLNQEEDGEGRAVKELEQSEVAERCGCSIFLVYTVSKRYVQKGLEQAIKRKKRETPPASLKVTGEVEAKLIALSCSEPPAGYSRWTLRLLEEKSKVELGIELSDTTIWSVLKKNIPETASKKMPVYTAQAKRGVCRQQGGCS